MNRQDVIAKGHKAERELELTSDLLDVMRQQCLEGVVNARPEDVQTLIVSVRVIDRLRKQLGQLVQGAKLEEILSAQNPEA